MSASGSLADEFPHRRSDFVFDMLEESGKLDDIDSAVIVCDAPKKLEKWEETSSKIHSNGGLAMNV